MIKEKNVKIFGFWLMVVLFGVVAYCSYGYDDEYFNIAGVERAKSFIEYYRTLNSTDIHPPLSYLINYSLFQIFGNWRFVRLIGAVMTAIGLWIFWNVRESSIVSSEPHLADRTNMDVIFSYILICLNPTVLMWATGLRWYTYMTFLVCMLGILFYAKGKLNENKYLFWGIYFLICIIIFHMEYSGTFLIISSFLCFLMKRRKNFKHEWYVILVFGLSACAAVAYQSYIFFTVHYKNGLHEIGSIPSAIVYTAQHLLCGQAVMPVSIWGILLLIGNSILYITVLLHYKEFWKNSSNRFVVFCYIGIILSGIGIKIRNYTPISPMLGGLCEEAFSKIKKKKIKYAAAVLIFIGTIGGIYNVVAHVNTTKGSWNTPYNEILDYVLQYEDTNEDVLVLSHNPVIDHWIAQESDMSVLNIASDYAGWHEKVEQYQGTLIVLDSYKGSLQEQHWILLKDFLERNKDRVMEQESFGNDRYAWFKQLVDKEYPSSYMDIYVINK